MRLNNLLLLFIQICLFCTSISYALELSASTGNGGSSSSTQVVYGSSFEDYAQEHIKLNSESGTLSNSFSGSGSLPLSSISNSDAKGNYVSVSRSVNGKAGTTTWYYDWETYTPYSTVVGNGVGAWLAMTAKNAYSIFGSGYASNSEGDIACATTTVGSSTTSATSTLSNYLVNPTAFTNEVDCVQKTDYATSTSKTVIKGYSDNAEGDHTEATITTTAGTITLPSYKIYTGSKNGWTYPTVLKITTTGTGTISALTSCAKEADSSSLEIKVVKGNINSADIYAWGGSGIEETISATMSSASGTTTQIKGHAQNKYPATMISGSTSYSINSGSADFLALKTSNAAFSKPVVKIKATASDVDISSSGTGKTALILEPYKSELGNLFGTAGTYLAKKGYAVTSYGDSGVSWDKVYKLDEYKISLINTYGVTTSTGDSYGLAISRGDSTKSWASLTPYLTNPKSANDMMILDASSSFKLNANKQRPGATAVAKAKVRGGFAGTLTKENNIKFMNTFFTRLCAGDTVSAANTAATKAVSSKQTMLLQGNTAYKLA
jgi:hypothetical protein